jgi:O6-methylguanine-DNA--protein-cysteine methyltransferase
MTTVPGKHVKSTLPLRWEHDEVYAEGVYASLRRYLTGDTLNYQEIAVRVGVSDRTVGRFARAHGLARRVQRV